MTLGWNVFSITLLSVAFIGFLFSLEDILVNVEENRYMHIIIKSLFQEICQVSVIFDSQFILDIDVLMYKVLA